MAVNRSLFGVFFSSKRQFTECLWVCQPVLCNSEPILNSSEFLFLTDFKCMRSAVTVHNIIHMTLPYAAVWLTAHDQSVPGLSKSHRFLLPLFLNTVSSNLNKSACICRNSFLICFCLSRFN